MQGNNSAPIEQSGERLVVVRLLEHKTAAKKELAEVKPAIVAVILKDKAQRFAVEKAKQLKDSLEAGKAIDAVAAENKLAVKTEKALVRGKSKLPEALSEAIFKAAKPVGDKANIFVIGLPSGEQMVVSLSKVVPGVMSEEDKKQMDLAKKNIANALGQTEFNQVLNSLQTEADVEVIRKPQAQ